MSLYDKASLVLIPSGTKEGTIFSQKPTNGDGDFTFSRSTSATRVGASGYIEKETQNLLLQSNSFDTTWSTSSSSITSGQSGYDGSSDAWLLQATASVSTARLQQGVSISGVHTSSIYAKAGSTDWIAVQMWSNHFAYFDVANGVVGNTGSAIDASIEAVGNGYYRCSLSYNASSVSNFWVYVVDGNGSTAVTSGKNIYIQDAQLEQGLVARDYIETTTSAVYGGITDNIPRLDYNGSCPSLLLEPQRTNLFTNSEYIDGWSNAGGTSSQNSTDSTSPEGLYNSAVLDASSVRYQTFSISSSAHSYSVYAKAKSGSILGLRIDTPTTKDTYFNLSDGTIQSTGSGHTASIEAVGNGWYRCIISFTDSIVNAVLETTSSGSVYIWGAQLEQGSYATSYIPTYGGAAVTRNQDSCSVTGVSDLIGQSEGTLFIEFNINNLSSQDNNPIIITAKDSGSNDNIYIQTRADGGVRGIYYSSGVVEGFTNSGAGYISDGNHKIAFAYKNNDFALYIDGVEVDTDASGTTGDSFDELYLGYYSASFNPYVNNKQALLFKTRLSNEELAALTTI